MAVLGLTRDPWIEVRLHIYVQPYFSDTVSRISIDAVFVISDIHVFQQILGGSEDFYIQLCWVLCCVVCSWIERQTPGQYHDYKTRTSGYFKPIPDNNKSSDQYKIFITQNKQLILDVKIAVYENTKQLS